MDIKPEKENLDTTFSRTTFYIDFYQRDYRWTEEPVRRLLDDIFYQFDEAYAEHRSKESNVETISQYPWYYLNTYVTNTVGGRVFVVDGQQRLTTLTLILCKLLQLAREFQSKRQKWIESRIVGSTGDGEEFWMHHARHLQVLNALHAGDDLAGIDTSSGVTAVNMVNNFKLVSSYLDERLKETHRFETFVYYFLHRLVLVNLSVDTTHVPMVFEVINDRGVRLKPFEILKGKLLGQIDKRELTSGGYDELWEDQVGAVNAFKEDEIDNFFRYWLKSKYTDTRKTGQKYDGDYHREMFRNETNAALGLDHDAVKVKRFLKTEFRYYTDLYVKLWKLTESQSAAAPAAFYNKLNELDGQFLLVLGACKVDDKEEDYKIDLVTAGLDRLFTLLYLQGSYDSNEFAALLYKICSEIRDSPASEISGVFDKYLIETVSAKRGIDVIFPFNYQFFRGMSIDRLRPRFVRYLFARVEQFLAEGTKVRMRHAFEDLVTKSGHVNGFHLEHILSRNDENLAHYASDDEQFDDERNRLGGVLILKGRDNISSGNEKFVEKLKSYAGTLLWNETLRSDTYQSNLDLRTFADKESLSFRPLDTFGPLELEERQRLLADIVQRVWVNRYESA